MNLVLLEPAEVGVALPRTDSRAVHILEVLRRKVGDGFHAGVVDGPIGTATLEAIELDGLRLSFEPKREPPPLPAITLIVGLCRPATARDILRDATTLGVQAIHFVSAERTNATYATSNLWRDGEWRRSLLGGAAQGFDTRLPEVTWTHRLSAALDFTGPGDRIALDNYEAVVPYASQRAARVNAPFTLAIGPERGWGAVDREQLRASGAVLCHLGSRVLRVEMAVVAALAINEAVRG